MLKSLLVVPPRSGYEPLSLHVLPRVDAPTHTPTPRWLDLRAELGLPLSMIEPESWHQRWIGTFRLNADGRWQVDKVAEDFDLRAYVTTSVG